MRACQESERRAGIVAQARGSAAIEGISQTTIVKQLSQQYIIGEISSSQAVSMARRFMDLPEGADHKYVHESCQSDSHAYANGVLLNTKGLKDTDSLNKFEASMVEPREWMLADNPIAGKYDLIHAQAIHKSLFQDVYPWAGELRGVDTSKGSTYFCPHDQIESEFIGLSEYLAQSSLYGNEELSIEDFSREAAIYFGRLNWIHPFREGNGRTQRVLFSYLAAEHGISLVWSAVSKDAMVRACNDAMSDPSCRQLARLLLLNSVKIMT